LFILKNKIKVLFPYFYIEKKMCYVIIIIMIFNLF